MNHSCFWRYLISDRTGENRWIREEEIFVQKKLVKEDWQGNLPCVPVSWTEVTAPAPEKSEGKHLDYRTQSLTNSYLL